MKRLGIILSYNSLSGYGIIKDKNGQKIRFHNEDNRIVYNRFEVVQFCIGMVNNRLVALEIIKIPDSEGKTMSLGNLYS